MADSHLDQHLVAHDLIALTLAAALGAVAAVITGSTLLGLGTALLLAALGIGLMRVQPFRHAVNRLTMTTKEGNR